MFGLFGKPSPAKFAKLVMDAARQAGLAGGLTFHEAEFQLKYDGGRLFLGNLYAQYCQADRPQKKLLMANCISILVRKEETISRAQAFEQCVAVVRERALFSFLEVRGQVEKFESAPVSYVPLSQWFVRCLVLDAPGYMRMVTKEDLKKWGVSFDELFEAGLERLRDCCVPKFQQEGGIFAGAWHDDYDSSRILMPEVFEELPLRGAPVFCIPNRLTLLVADSSDPAAIEAMLGAAEEIVQHEPRRHNPAPMTYQDGEVVDFTPRPGTSLAHAVQRARGIAGVIYYDEQTALLQSLHEKSGKDIYVGKYTLVQRESGEFMTYAVWSKGVPALLPRTDIIMFYDPAQPEKQRTIGAVKWEDVEAAAGDLLLDAEMFPPRFYVSKFPTAEQFAAMPKVQL